MGVSAAVGAAVIGAAATGYSVHEQRATAEKAAANADQLAAAAREDANKIALPNTIATAAQQQQNAQRAASAGGTITNTGTIGDSVNTPKKSLLGS